MNKNNITFIDVDHPVMDKYYEFLDIQGRNSYIKTERKMKKIIKSDPEFLDPYLILYEQYIEFAENEKASQILEIAYCKAIEKITDGFGNWPHELCWAHRENRHIIRTIGQKALHLWSEGRTKDALDLFRRLLRSDPNDNSGSRHCILAILIGWSREEFEEKMRSKDGFYFAGKKMLELESRVKEFPEEFDWWFDATESQTD